MRIDRLALALGFLATGVMLPLRPLAAQGSDAAVPADPMPSHEMFRLTSALLNERRVINVHLPLGYDTAASRRYPVVYMPDGGLAEDFPHIVNTLDSLVALGRIRPVIVVGIENTERRRDLTGPTTVARDSAIAVRVGGAARFRQFISDELMPTIQRRYRTTGETTLVGESLAGLFVVETALLTPSLFRHYIALSPSVWWNRGALVDSAEARLPGLAAADHTLLFASADEAEIASGTARLADLLGRAAPPHLVWRYQPRPDLTHGTIFRAMVPAFFVEALH